MDQYRIYRMIERLYGRVPQRLPFLRGWAFPPLQVVFELTYRCNLRCKFCYQRREENQLGIEFGHDELTADEIGSIVAKTAPWTLIIFTGGEPFVRRDIMSILGGTARKRRCHVVSNGTCITPEIAQELVNMGLTSLGISIEGLEQVQDTIRGSGTFAKATAAARSVIEFRKQRGKRSPLVNVKTTITAENVAHLTEIVGLTQQLGADYCSFQIMNTSTMISGMYLQNDLKPYGQQPQPIQNVPLDVLEQQSA